LLAISPFKDGAYLTIAKFTPDLSRNIKYIAVLKKVRYALCPRRPMPTEAYAYAQSYLIFLRKAIYVYGFVKPKTGETLWYLIPRVNTLWLNLVYNNFAIDAGISDKKKAFLVEDNAGWHRSKKVETHAGIIVDYLPAYSPELQPAERLWTLVDEPLVNEYFETIDEMEEVLIKRCNVLSEMKEEI
jgi:transposase